MLAHDTLDLRNRSAHISAKTPQRRLRRRAFCPNVSMGPTKPTHAKKASTRIDAF